MSERDELIECLRVCGACHGCGIGADGDTCTNCGDERQLNRLAADLLERDGDELARLTAAANAPSITGATIAALAAIDAELGLPEDGCNSTVRTLTAIRLLHSAHRDDVAEIARLERALKLQRNAALTLADASAAVSGARLEQARKLFAESRPESVESERAMNAILTADVERLERELAEARVEIDGPRNRCPQCDHLRLEIGEARRQLNALPANWLKDSSLETWFPITAMKLEDLQAERDEARAALAEEQKDAERYRVAQANELIGYIKRDHMADCYCEFIGLDDAAVDAAIAKEQSHASE